MRIAVTLLTLFLLSACNTGTEQEEPETNVVKDYITVPKERAQNARSAVESAQRRTAEQGEELE